MRDLRLFAAVYCGLLIVSCAVEYFFHYTPTQRYLVAVLVVAAAVEVSIAKRA